MPVVERDTVAKAHSALTAVLAAVLAALLGTTFTAFAQTTTGALTGTIYDQSGAVIPGAALKITSVATGVTQTVQTNHAGVYNLVGVMPNQYNLTVTAKGFLTETGVVAITLGQISTLDFHLKVGNSQQTVEVNASESSLELERDSHEIATVMSDQTIENLPANGRDVFQTLTAAPNVNPFLGNVGDNTTFWSLQPDSLTMGGTVYGTTSYLQDGVDNFNLVAKSANLQPSIESVQQVSLVTNGASARYDEPSVVNVITKSGTESFHGRVYEYLRNDALDAIGYFKVPKPSVRYNQFGVNLGGPILKNKLFFFFDYSGLRYLLGETLNAIVPGTAERTGNFSADSYTIYDPSTYNSTTGTISAFPNNTIPSGEISNFAKLILAYYPAPTPSAIANDNFQKSANETTIYDSYLGRLDYTIGKNDLIYGAYETTNPVINPPNFSSTLFNNITVQNASNAYVEETHTFNSDLVNIGRFGYNYSNVDAGPAGAGQQDYLTAYGIQNLAPESSLVMPPSVDLSTISSLGSPNSPNGAIQRLFEIEDEVDWTIGRHSIFLGGEVDYIRLQRFSQDYNDGLYTFTGQFTSNHNTASEAGGSDLADLLLGYPEAAEGGVGNTLANFTQTNVVPYIQDDWKVTKRLVLNLGMRYDFNSSPNSPAASVYDVPTNTTYPGSYLTNYLNLAPRVGFAYSVNAATAVHGGYGIYYTPFDYQELTDLLIHEPNFFLQSYTYAVTSPPVAATNTFVASPTGTSASSAFTLTRGMPMPGVQEWNLAAQRSVGQQWIATISYLGTKFTHKQLRINPNQAALPSGPTDTSSIQSRRPYPWTGDVNEATDIGIANYNAMQIDVQRRMANGYSLEASYVWSKSMDEDSSSSEWLEHAHDPRADYGQSDYNPGQILKISGIYQLPFGLSHAWANRNNWLDRDAIGGWQASGILTVYSGLPFSTAATDNSDTGAYHDQRANQTCNGNLGAPHTIAKWFNTSCFVQPAYGELGNEQRNNLIGPHDTNLDLSLFKNFPLWKEKVFQFRSDFFSALNNPQLGTPAASISAATFGEVTSIGGARVIQLSMKLIF